MTMRVVLNVTSSADWHKRPVGIIRVEREVTKAIYAQFGEGLTPVYLDREHGRWMTLDVGCFKDLMSDDWVSNQSSKKDELNIQHCLSSFFPENDDRFVTVGSDWSFNVPDKVAELYGTKRVLVPACYDLIPLLLPEFAPGMEFYDQFDYHYRAVARLARSVFAISEVSACSLRDFWKENGLDGIAPPVEVVPLAAPALADDPVALNTDDQVVFDEINDGEPYAIYVSTIEPRKNHQLLLDIWRELYEERGKKCPKLLIVGVRGWGCDDLLRSMSRMIATKAGKVLWREGLSDALLSRLYTQSSFAVFPSYFEGWGLAATEAANLGKVCIVSTAGALVEATKGMMPSYHHLDFLGWKQEIIRLFDDDDYRKLLQSRLESTYFQRTWYDFGAEFCLKFLSGK